jgi:iron complex outermembrane receptor protein
MQHIIVRAGALRPAIALLVAGSAAPVLAQEVPAAAPAAGGLEDIVVTATRREERLQNVPVTVTALTSRSLTGTAVVDARTLTQVVPGYSGNRTSSVILPVIRGVGSGGVSIGDEPNVALYIDGIYQPDAFSNAMELVEVERVEVLKGPQGTVFGRNATGGLINIITPDPSFETRGRISARYGRMRNDAGDLDLRGYVTGALSEKVAIDFSGMYRETDPYIKELALGKDLGWMRTFDARSKILFQPSDRSQLILTVGYTNQDSNVNASQPLDNNTIGRQYSDVLLPQETWQSSSTFEPRIDFEKITVSLRGKFEFDGFNLETASAYMRNKAKQTIDSDATNLDLGIIDLRLKAQAVSQEVRLLSNSGGRLNWIAGAYAYHFWGTFSYVDFGVPNPGGRDLPMVHTYLKPDMSATSFAGFAEGTYQLAEPLFLTVGGRYTTEKREFEQVLNGRPMPYGQVSKTFNRATYRAALRYEFAPKSNVYASYGTGFKSGVYNVVAVSSQPVAPEKIKAAEVGVKSDPLPWLRTNISGFYYDYSDLQVQARNADGSGFVLLNAANSEIYGGEAEITVAPTTSLNIRGGVSWLHGKYKDFTQAQDFVPLAQGGNRPVSSDASGKWVIRAPRFSAMLGVDWRTDLAGGELGINANVMHSDRIYYDVMNRFSQDPYEMVSGEISWTAPGGHTTLSVWATNLTNEKVAQQVRPSPLGTDILYEKPRVIGVGAQYKF